MAVNVSLMVPSTAAFMATRKESSSSRNMKSYTPAAARAPAERERAGKSMCACVLRACARSVRAAASQGTRSSVTARKSRERRARAREADGARRPHALLLLDRRALLGEPLGTRRLTRLEGLGRLLDRTQARGVRVGVSGRGRTRGRHRLRAELAACKRAHEPCPPMRSSAPARRMVAVPHGTRQTSSAALAGIPESVYGPYDFVYLRHSSHVWARSSSGPLRKRAAAPPQLLAQDFWSWGIRAPRAACSR